MLFWKFYGKIGLIPTYKIDILKTAITQIIKGLYNELNNIESEIEDILLKSEQGIIHSKKAYNQLKNVIADKEFNTKAQEIHFFKYLKPKVCSKLVYYVRLLILRVKDQEEGIEVKSNT